MLLSTSTGYLKPKLSYKKVFQTMKATGFDAYDFSASSESKTAKSPLMRDNYMDFARQLKEWADEAGLICNQAHATFPPEKYGDEEYNKTTFQRILREMEVSAYLGAKCIVVHAVKPLPKGVDAWAENLRFYRSLLPYCEKFNIKVAVENLFEYDEVRERLRPCFIGTSEKLARFVDELGSDWFTVCLDIGHAAINTEDPEDAIRTLGKRITAVHIHDNNFVNDRHTIPYLGKANWDAICQAFADIGYEGEFTLETVLYENSFPAELLPAALKFEAEIAKHLIAKIEKG